MGRILSKYYRKKTFGLYDAYSNSIPFSFIINHKKTHMAKPSNSHNYVSKHKAGTDEIMDDFALEGEVLRDSLDKIAKINQLWAETS
jgi:hypothetical protein